MSATQHASNCPVGGYFACTCGLKQENLTLHEQVAALESREVCARAHDNVETCGYCQRDELAKALHGMVAAYYAIDERHSPDYEKKYIAYKAALVALAKAGL